MGKHRNDPKLTSNPKHKRDKRLGEYGPRNCPWCARKLRFTGRGLFCPDDACGWVENK